MRHPLLLCKKSFFINHYLQTFLTVLPLRLPLWLSERSVGFLVCVIFLCLPGPLVTVTSRYTRSIALVDSPCVFERTLLKIIIKN